VIDFLDAVSDRERADQVLDAVARTLESREHGGLIVDNEDMTGIHQ